MLRIFGQTIPSDCVEGTQCFEDFLHRGLEPWRNDHGTTTDPVMTVTITTSSFNMEVNEAKMAIYILSGCILSLCKWFRSDTYYISFSVHCCISLQESLQPRKSSHSTSTTPDPMDWRYFHIYTYKLKISSLGPITFDDSASETDSD